MPFDQAGFTRRVLTEQESADLAALRRMLNGLSQRRGWIKGDFHRDGGHCLVGWAMIAHNEELLPGVMPFLGRVFGPLQSRFAGHLEGESLNDRDINECLTNWNDDDARRKSQVIALVRKAIARIETADGR